MRLFIWNPQGPSHWPPLGSINPALIPDRILNKMRLTDILPILLEKI